ncbi:hypothetical protein BS47DRAFT_1381693 [Hydnum rufescens UP504]|uniref:Membrane fraction protein n=1 Tax=Hydnum rufescens UP504 TaxID=1448309 RepID=A0A9P6DYK6_9AGAM|nr:hypothetical protein BS47DRAFT_1381693 [Hydnum rufescens UP504]
MSDSTFTAPVVPLPRRPGLEPRSGPLWAFTNSSPEDVPLPVQCDRHSMEGHVCCKTMKGDDERTLIDPDIVRDVIIGLSDGLTVPFALTAGLSSIGNSRIVVVGGLAELIAGAISMGIGGFLASKAERDHFYYTRKHTRDRVLRSCLGEIQREVHAVLGPVGVDEKISRQVADSLLALEDERARATAATAEETNAVQRRSWLAPGLWSFGKNQAKRVSDDEGGLRWSEDVGLTAFLLKFGEGMEEVPSARLYISAFTIGMGYFIGGLVPLLPYFWINPATTALLYSCLVTGIILLIFGAVKQHVTGAVGGVRGYLWGRSVRYLSGALLLEPPSASSVRLKCSHARKEVINQHEDEETWSTRMTATRGQEATGSPFFLVLTFCSQPVQANTLYPIYSHFHGSN